MGRLDPLLGEAGVVARDLHHLVGEGRVVAGVAEDDRHRFPPGVGHPQHRHRLVRRARGVHADLEALLRLLATVHGEIGLPDPVS
jgi:hypothetical protein